MNKTNWHPLHRIFRDTVTRLQSTKQGDFYHLFETLAGYFEDYKNLRQFSSTKGNFQPLFFALLRTLLHLREQAKKLAPFESTQITQQALQPFTS